jgi:hypothetical protein
MDVDLMILVWGVFVIRETEFREGVGPDFLF